MKYKKTVINIAFLLLGLGSIHAQESSVSSGGEATGTGGTSSYSVGEVVYITHTGSNGTVAQGVQQPYEISITTGMKETSIDIEISIYPNPTTNYLTLKTEDNSNLSYQLYDLQGKVIESKKVSTNSTTITMEKLTNATYFLKVLDKNKIIKTFKIIKN